MIQRGPSHRANCTIFQQNLKENRMSQQVLGSKFSRRQFLQSGAALGAAVSLLALAGCAPAPAGAPAASSGGAAAPAAAAGKVLFWKPPHSPNEADLWKPLL